MQIIPANTNKPWMKNKRSEEQMNMYLVREKSGLLTATGYGHVRIDMDLNTDNPQRFRKPNVRQSGRPMT